VAHVYEEMIGAAFSDMYRVLPKDGIACVMFAYKTTTVWETLIAGLLRSGLNVTASWPIHTEMKTRMIAIDTAALASSVTLVCRKRIDGAEAMACGMTFAKNSGGSLKNALTSSGVKASEELTSLSLLAAQRCRFSESTSASPSCLVRKLQSDNFL
jgi:adenine-specific DNA methylase